MTDTNITLLHKELRKRSKREFILSVLGVIAASAILLIIF